MKLQGQDSLEQLLKASSQSDSSSSSDGDLAVCSREIEVTTVAHVTYGLLL